MLTHDAREQQLLPLTLILHHASPTTTAALRRSVCAPLGAVLGEGAPRPLLLAAFSEISRLALAAPVFGVASASFACLADRLLEAGHAEARQAIGLSGPVQGHDLQVSAAQCLAVSYYTLPRLADQSLSAVDAEPFLAVSKRFMHEASTPDLRGRVARLVATLAPSSPADLVVSSFISPRQAVDEQRLGGKISSRFIEAAALCATRCALERVKVQPFRR